MAERVYHVRSTGQMVVLNVAVVEHVLEGLREKQQALQSDIDALAIWLSSEREGEECTAVRSTGGTGDSSPSSQQP